MSAIDYSLYEKKLDDPISPIIAIDNSFLIPELKIFYIY